MQNAGFPALRGLGTDAFWLSIVRKKGAVKAATIDTNALIKMITQGSPVHELALLDHTVVYFSGLGKYHFW